MSAKTSLFIDGCVIIALVLVGGAGYMLSPLLLPEVDLTITPEGGCDLQKIACKAFLPDGGILHLGLAPRPIPVIEPMEVQVTLTGVDASRVAVDFAGVSMNMGLNRQQLEKQDGDRFVGRATLPVCITGTMTWEATVLVEAGRKRIAVPFRFEVGR